MQPPVLTSLARVKAWLGIDTDASDLQLTALIRAVSTFLYKYIDLPTVVVSPYVELRDSQGHNWIRPFNWPLISVASINYGGNSITTLSTGNPANAGYLINQPNGNLGPSRITLQGQQQLPFGKNVVTLSYTAGFQEIEDCLIFAVFDTADPPVAVAWTILLTELWAADGGVVYTATGVALTKVDATPAVGEYTVVDGVYGFNSAEVGEEVTVTYSYVPADLAQAATELVGATFQDASHIGIRSKTLGGQETVSYFQNMITPSQAMFLQPYRRVTPRS